jgi:pimeloyl-ACP methyl ester carboxylesterase
MNSQVADPELWVPVCPLRVSLAALVLGLAALAPTSPARAGELAIGEESTPKEYGERIEFRVRGKRAFLILPKDWKDAKTPQPWIWYAPVLEERFPNEWHDWLFYRLVRRGVVIAGIDAGESWGNIPGRKTYSLFYSRTVKKYNLRPKAILFCESRGMLMGLNWAAENADKVAAVGAVYPVCRIDASPFFARTYDLASHLLSESEYSNLLRDQKLNARNLELLEQHLKDHNPLDRLEPLAKANVPMLLLHGLDDRMVPAIDHSGALVRRYRKLGGRAGLVLYDGCKHEPSDLFFQSERMLDFLLTQAGVAREPEEVARGKPEVQPAGEDATEEK